MAAPWPVGRPLRASSAILGLLLLATSLTPAPSEMHEGAEVESSLAAQDITLSDHRPENITAPSPQPPIAVTIPIHIVLLGVPSELVDATVVRDQLLGLYEPTSMAPYIQLQLRNRHIQYQFAYDIKWVPAATANAYASWLRSNARWDTAPFWIQGLSDAPANRVALVPADEALSWLETNLAAYLSTGYSIVFVDAYHTNPAMPRTYFYEFPVSDVDLGTTLSPARSRYLTGFSGGPSRLLFLDLSAGPSNVSFPAGISVDRTRMPPIWDYGPGDRTRFSTDLAVDTTFAVVQRFVPSYFAPPVFSPAYHLDATIFSGDSSRRYASYLNLPATLAALRDLQPFATWTGSVQEVAISADADLDAVVRANTNPAAQTVDPFALSDYFEANLADYVAPRDDATVVPLFLFGFPGRLRAPGEILGWVHPIQGRPGFVTAIWDDEILGLLPRPYFDEPGRIEWANATFTVPSGGSTFFTGGLAGVANAILLGREARAWLNGTIDVTSGQVDFYLFTEYEYGNWTRGGGEPILALRGLAGTTESISVTIPAPGYYYAIFHDSVGTSPGVTFRAVYEQYAGAGFTQTVIHEVGHFVGLNHPHDGVLFQGSEVLTYAHWFFDFSHSAMSYLTTTTAFDRFDKDAVLRGNVATFLESVMRDLGSVLSTMREERVRLIPFNVLGHLNNSLRYSLAAKLLLEENDYLSAFEAALAGRLAMVLAASTLSEDLELPAAVVASLDDSDGVLDGAPEVTVMGQVFDIRNFTLEVLVDGWGQAVPFGRQGEFRVAVRDLFWGRHEIVVRATDANGTVLVRSLAVEVPISPAAVAALGAAALVAGTAGFLLLRRRRARRMPPPLDFLPPPPEIPPPPPPEWP